MLQVNLDGSDEIALDADRKLELGGELMHIDSNRYLCAAVLDKICLPPCPSSPSLSHHPLCQEVWVSLTCSPGHGQATECIAGPWLSQITQLLSHIGSPVCLSYSLLCSIHPCWQAPGREKPL